MLAVLVLVEWAIQVLVAVRQGSGGAFAVLVALALSPLAVVATARIGERLAGPRYGIASGAAFVLLPPAGSLYFLDAYDHVWSHDVLPHLLGLRGTSTYALTVLLAVAAAGLPRTVLAVAGIVALAVAFAVWSLAALGDVKRDLHETGWSVGLLEWLPLAGALGAVLRSRRLGVALLGWLGFFVLRAAGRTYADGSFWIALEPALPAAAVLVASVGLLVPPFTERAAAARAS